MVTSRPCSNAGQTLGKKSQGKALSNHVIANLRNFLTTLTTKSLIHRLVVLSIYFSVSKFVYFHGEYKLNLKKRKNISTSTSLLVPSPGSPLLGYWSSAVWLITRITRSARSLGLRCWALDVMEVQTHGKFRKFCCIESSVTCLVKILA